MTSDAPWNPPGRVRKLLEERDALGRPLVFVETGPDGPVHVVGPDEDQPGYGSVADWLLTRRYRAVCGPVIRLRTAALDGYIGRFDDSRICPRCLRAFNRAGADAGAAIFADNTDAIQADAAAVIYRIQRDKTEAVLQR